MPPGSDGPRTTSAPSLLYLSGLSRQLTRTVTTCDGNCLTAVLCSLISVSGTPLRTAAQAWSTRVTTCCFIGRVCFVWRRRVTLPRERVSLIAYCLDAFQVSECFLLDRYVKLFLLFKSVMRHCLLLEGLVSLPCFVKCPIILSNNLLLPPLPVIFMKASLSRYTWHIPEDVIELISVYIPLQVSLGSVCDCEYFEFWNFYHHVVCSNISFFV